MQPLPPLPHRAALAPIADKLLIDRSAGESPWGKPKGSPSLGEMSATHETVRGSVFRTQRVSQERLKVKSKPVKQRPEGRVIQAPKQQCKGPEVTVACSGHSRGQAEQLQQPQNPQVPIHSPRCLLEPSLQKADLRLELHAAPSGLETRLTAW